MIVPSAVANLVASDVDVDSNAAVLLSRVTILASSAATFDSRVETFPVTVEELASNVETLLASDVDIDSNADVLLSRVTTFACSAAEVVSRADVVSSTAVTLAVCVADVLSNAVTFAESEETSHGGSTLEIHLSPP